MRFVLAVGFSAISAILAQPAPSEPAVPVLQYFGKPLVLAYDCTPDDIQWAGLSCSDEEPCPLYFELAAVEAVGNKIIAAGNIHSAATTLYSVLLVSDDLGKTWHEPHQRLRASALDHVQFVDFENGWISGQMLQPLPQDPFFLITSDGGKSWRHRPVFSETRTGTVAQFWFSSRTAGGLVIDRGQAGDLGRYELYDTPNGGETWSLRETNEKPIRLKRAAGGNPDWRIRADARTKAFCVERRQGERWTILAAFAVRIGTCKPAERTEPPPPEPAEEAPPPPPPASPRKPPTLKRPG